MSSEPRSRRDACSPWKRRVLSHQCFLKFQNPWLRGARLRSTGVKLFVFRQTTTHTRALFLFSSTPARRRLS